MSVAQTMRNILGIIVSPKFSALDKLNEIQLRPLTFVVPTVDGATFLSLQNIGGDWGHRLMHDPIINPVKMAIDNLIVTTTEEVNHFDFADIQSISASKSLMNGPASCYQGVLEWGNNMHAGANINFESDRDFEDNVAHVKYHMLHRDKGLKLEKYSWHSGRNCVNNNGGSHHAAALVRQLHAQGRKYQCKATVTKYSINEEALSGLNQDFYLFIADDNCDKATTVYYVALTLSNMGLEFATLSFPRTGKEYRLYVVPKHQDAITPNDMQTWIETNVHAKNMINFFEFVKYAPQVLDRHAIQYTQEHNL